MPAAFSHHPYATSQNPWHPSPMPIKIQTTESEYIHQDPLRRQSDSYLNWGQPDFDDDKDVASIAYSLSSIIGRGYEDDDDLSSISSPIEIPSLDAPWAGDQSSCGNLSLQTSLSSSNSISSVTPDYSPVSSGGFCGMPLSSPRITTKEPPRPFANYTVNPDVWMNWDDSRLMNIAPSISPSATQLKVEPRTPNMDSGANLLHTPSLDTAADVLLDTSIDFQDAVDEPLFPTPLPTPQELSLRAHDPASQTYNEQSWSRPQPPAHNNSSATAGSQQHQQSYFYPTLSPSEEANLRAIAMPSKTSSSLSSSPDDSIFSSSSGRGMRPRKRKSSTPTEEEEEEEDESPDSVPQPPVKKTAHNMIEKRYRTNLNDKIAALRQSVPSLRVTEKTINSGNNRRGGDVMEDLDGLTPANKLNKATILSKATEYIGHLERRNQTLIREKKALLDRIEAFENLIMGRKNSGQGMYTPDQLMLQHNQMMEQSGHPGLNDQRSGRHQM